MSFHQQGMFHPWIKSHVLSCTRYNTALRGTRSLCWRHLETSEACVWPHNKDCLRGDVLFSRCHNTRLAAYHLISAGIPGMYVETFSWTRWSKAPVLYNLLCVSEWLNPCHVFISDIYTLWKVLHLQFWKERTVPPVDHERRDGEWPGADVGHPAGWIFACMGRDR